MLCIRDDYGNGIPNGNGNPMGMNPMRMGIDDKIGNGNGKEWECKKPLPVISALYMRTYSADLNTHGIAVAKNTQQFVVRYEEETREGVALRVQVVVQRLLAFFQDPEHVFEVRQAINCQAALLYVGVFHCLAVDTMKVLINLCLIHL